MARTAVITGGVSGLGRASAARLAEDGINVITFDIAEAPTWLSTSQTPLPSHAPRQRSARSTFWSIAPA